MCLSRGHKKSCDKCFGVIRYCCPIITQVNMSNIFFTKTTNDFQQQLLNFERESNLEKFFHLFDRKQAKSVNSQSHPLLRLKYISQNYFQIPELNSFICVYCWVSASIIHHRPLTVNIFVQPWPRKQTLFLNGSFHLPKLKTIIHLQQSRFKMPTLKQS